MRDAAAIWRRADRSLTRKHLSAGATAVSVNPLIATTATIHDLEATATLPGNLYPGKKLDASASVTNTNEYPVKLTGLTNPTLTQTGGSGCTLENSKIKPTLPPVPPTVNAGQTLNVNIPVEMGKDADEKCAGSTLTVRFDLRGEVA